MNTKVLAGISASLFLTSAVHAATVYDLSTGTGNGYFLGTSESGDELHLGGTDRVIESFSFDYFANYSQVGGLIFRIYANDGVVVNGNKVPGTILDTRTLDVTVGGGHVLLNYPFDPANVLPDTITYTATFSGIEGSPAKAGLILPDSNPTVGTSFDDIWSRTGPGAGDWTLLHVTDQNGAPVIGNFKATVTATPEPGAIALMSLGGVALLFISRRRG